MKMEENIKNFRWSLFKHWSLFKKDKWFSSNLCTALSNIDIFNYVDSSNP